MANVLWLVESEYPKFDQSKPGLTTAAWAQYGQLRCSPLPAGGQAGRARPGAFTIVYADNALARSGSRRASVDLGCDRRRRAVEYIGGSGGKISIATAGLPWPANSPPLTSSLRSMPIGSRSAVSCSCPAPTAPPTARAFHHRDRGRKPRPRTRQRLQRDPCVAYSASSTPNRPTSRPAGYRRRSSAQAVFLRIRAGAEHVLGRSSKIVSRRRPGN